MTTTYTTTVDLASLAAARVLADSLRAVDPEARLVVCADHATHVAETMGRPQRPLELTDAATPPVAVRRLLEQGASLVVYLDPWTLVLDSLDPVLELARRHGVAVASRAQAIPSDGRSPSADDLRDAGAVSETVVAVTPGRAADELLGAWEAGAEWARVAGRRVPSPERYPAESIVEDPGCAVSAWNLHERPLHREGERLLAAEAPLRSMSFAGFRPDRPYWLSEDADRVLVVDDPVLTELCADYASRLHDAGWVPPIEHLGGLERLVNGQRIDHLMRSLWREHRIEENFGSPLVEADADGFVAWLRGPAEHGAASGVNRYLYAAYLTRPDLQKAFPDLDGADGQPFMAWAWAHGKLELLAELLPATEDDGGLADDYRLGVNVIGYLRDTLGLAEAARLYVEGLVAAHVPVTTTAISPDMPVGVDERVRPPVHHRAGHQEYRDRRSPVEPAFNLVCANGDQLDALLRAGGSELLAGRPTIGQWGWETDVLPQSWLSAFRHVDEIWVYTRFVAENLGRIAPVPVVVVPMAITVPDITDVSVPYLADDRFTFLFMFDFFSTLRRKNAVGLIRAFTRAFAPGEGPRLLIKTINAAERPQARDELRYEAGGRPDIDLVDGYLDVRQKSALLGGADCYVSLHRSEGFGLPLAEAMALGTPVIATGWSGNLDFMTPHNSWLVDSHPTAVGLDSELYPPRGTWAEPDLDHAAALMREVWTRPEEVARRSARAREDIERLYAPRVTGAIARARLERLVDAKAARTRPSSAGGSGSFETIERELALDLRTGAAPAPGGVEGVVRRAVLRLMAPFTYHQRTLDRAMFDAMRDLRRELERDRRARRGDRARLVALEDALEQRPGGPGGVSG